MKTPQVTLKSIISVFSPVILVQLAIISILSQPVVTDADTMRWSPVSTPDEHGNVIVSPSEVNAIAISTDGQTLYAIDIPNSKIYKSTNGGFSWNELTNQLASAGATLPAWNVALAPDNPNMVAVVTSIGGLPREVFVSADGGLTWWNAHFSASANIGAINISPYYGSYDVAIGTRTGHGTGDIHVLNTSAMGVWKDQGLGKDILAIRFSPNYRSDFTLVTLSAGDNGTYIDLGIHDTVANSTNWNLWGPAEITIAGAGTSPKVSQVITGDLELPADFSGQIAALRQLYVSIDAPGTNAGIYRFDDSVGYLLMPASQTLRISSIAYFGNCASGKLLAGEVLGNAGFATVTTWFTNNPATCSGYCWYKSEKAPTGSGNSGYANAYIIWSIDGKYAYCATSSAQLSSPANWPTGYLSGTACDESALSVSDSDGQIWNQISLIDTNVSFLSDVAVTLTSDTIFLASVNNQAGINSFDSVWRTTASTWTWERVLCILSPTDDMILRLDQNGNNRAVYLASRAAGGLWQSLDGGETWTDVSPGVNISDLAIVESGNTIHMYVLGGAHIRHGTMTAAQTWQWSSPVNTTLDSGHSIVAMPCGVVLVGDESEGIAAYSLDGGNSFMRTAPVPEHGKMHIAADCRFRNAVIVYAATDGPAGNIYSWAIGYSTQWAEMRAPGQRFYGLAQMSTLYGTWSSGDTSGVARTLEPEKLVAPYVEWDNLTAGLSDGVIFTREPTSLKISAGNNLWAIDNRPYTSTTGKLWTFYDCLSPSVQYPTTKTPSREMLFQAPVPVAPAKDEVIPVYLETRTIGDIVLKWKHPLPALEYEIWIAEDESFAKPIICQTIKPEDYKIVEWLIPKSAGLQSGTTYYWKVRVTQSATGERGNGDWSEIMSFSIASFPPETQKSEPAHQETPQDTAEHDVSSTVLAFLPWWAWTALVCSLLIGAALATIFIGQRQKRLSQKQ